jgi:hypothetical protein
MNPKPTIKVLLAFLVAASFILPAATVIADPGKDDEDKGGFEWPEGTSDEIKDYVGDMLRLNPTTGDFNYPAVSAEPAWIFPGWNNNEPLTIDELVILVDEKMAGTKLDPVVVAPDIPYEGVHHEPPHHELNDPTETRGNIYHEDFESGIPGNALILDDDGSGVTWDITNTNPYWSSGGTQTGYFMMIDDDAAGIGSDNYRDRLLLQNIDCSGYTGITLEWDGEFQDMAGDGEFWVNVSNGAGWNNVYYATADTPGPFGPIDVSMYADNQAFFEIDFNYDDDYGWAWGAMVDNVNLEGTMTSDADYAVNFLTLDGKRLCDPPEGCSIFGPGIHVPDANITNNGREPVFNLPIHATIWKEIYRNAFDCDFESSFVSYFDAISNDGDRDTWDLSDLRSHSPDHSAHCTRFETYQPLADDSLITRYPIDLSDADSAILEFWYWVEGEASNYKIYDYGDVWWSLDGGTTWINLIPMQVDPLPYVYWEYWWVSGTYVIYDTEGEWRKAEIDLVDQLGTGVFDNDNFLRFDWHADKYNCYEGWYLDDIKVIKDFKQEEIIWEAHKQVDILPGETITVEFPDPELYLDEGIYWYMVHQKFPDEVPDNDLQKHWIIIDDYHDVGVVDIEVTPDHQQMCQGHGGIIPVTINATIQNFGTYVEENVTVQVEIYQMFPRTIFEDDVEGGNKGWTHGSFSGPDLWHISDGTSHSPTHAWVCQERDIPFYDNGMDNNYLMSPTFRLEDAKDVTLYYNAKWAFQDYPSPGTYPDQGYFFLYDPASNYILGSKSFRDHSDTDGDGCPDWYGPDGSNGLGSGFTMTWDTVHEIGGFSGWKPFEMIGYWYERGLFLYSVGAIAQPFFAELGADGLYHGPVHEFAIGFSIWDSDATVVEHSEISCKWSGFAIDDVKLVAEYDGLLKYSEEFTLIGKLEDQGGQRDITLKWCPYFGNFEVDVCTTLPTDENPDNNCMHAFTHVYEVLWIDDVEGYTAYDTHPWEDDWTHGTGIVDTDSHWHIIDDEYGTGKVLWCGDDATGYYGNDWDESIWTNEINLCEWTDPQGFKHPVEKADLRFKFNAHVEDDYDWFYVDMSNDSGKNWDNVFEYTGQTDGWEIVDILIPDKFYCNEDVHIRFRFVSDDGYYWKGVHIDWVTIDIKGELKPPIGIWPNPLDYMAAYDFSEAWSLDTLGYYGYPPMGWGYLITDYTEQFGTPPWIGSTHYWHQAQPALHPTPYPEMAHSPPYCAEMWWGFLAQDEELILPEIFIPSGLQPEQRVYFEFWTYTFEEGLWLQEELVEISTDGGTSWTTLIDLGPVENFMVEPVVLDLTAYSGMPVMLKFHKITPDGGTGVWTIDDIRFYIDGVFIDVHPQFEDDFEFGLGKWNHGVTPIDLWQAWNYPPTIENFPYPTEVVAHSGDHYWGCEKYHYAPGGGWMYLPYMENVLISPEIDLLGAYHAHMVFWDYGQVEANYDHCYVGVREVVNGVPGPWGFLYEVFPDLTWTEHSVDLNYFIGKTIQLGFLLTSDLSVQYIGWKLDDIKIDIKRDVEDPMTTCDISGTMGDNGWYTSAVVVELGASDDIELEATYYRVDGGAWTLYDGRFSVSGDGDHTVEYYSVDKAGNVEDVKSCQGFKIDATNPTVGVSVPDTGYLYIFGRPILNIGRTIVIGSLTASATASDGTSGVNYVEFIYDGSVASADLTDPYEFELPFSLLPGTHTLQTRAVDKAGNSATSNEISYLKWF